MVIMKGCNYRKTLLNKLELAYEKVGLQIEEKLREIKAEAKNLDEKQIFKELCFCILVANNRLDKTLELWQKLDDDLLNYSKVELKKN